MNLKELTKLEKELESSITPLKSHYKTLVYYSTIFQKNEKEWVSIAEDTLKRIEGLEDLLGNIDILKHELKSKNDKKILE